ncbi:MAG: dihydropteroate synthase [Bacteroidetes bacterium]|nr:MAG: dihydropteroate synthase [Bacteroidota bacterium]
MGILNITPDSFYDGGRFLNLIDQLKQVEKMISEGAVIVDVGANSTRPGAIPVDEEEEMARLLPSLAAIRGHFSEVVISIDTYRSAVAKAAIAHGAMMINDIYGGRFDGEMFDLVARHNIPYVLMHMQGAPDNMQINPHYKDVVSEVYDFFRSRLDLLPSGFNQVVLDPGFGFGKTVENNFRLFQQFESFNSFGFPLLAGLSRKSMINRVLQIKPQEALNGTTVLNTIALLKGANILRVHDVKEAVEVIKLVGQLSH